MDELKQARLSINELDEEMAKLFEKRMNVASDIAKYKREHGLPITDAKREEELIEKNQARVEDPVIREYYTQYLRAMFKVSKEYQKRLNSGATIAYCGVPGAYAYLAASKLAGRDNLQNYSSFKKAYDAVLDGDCDGAVLPIENSYAGDVGAVMDLAFQGPLYISQIVELEITHALLAKKGTKLEDIKEVWSHPQALSQCDEYIHTHGFKTVEHSNTAAASKKLAESDVEGVAVIASPENAEIYGLEILEKGINSAANNTTKFGLFTRAYAKPLPEAKVGEHFVLVFTVTNEAGALAKALNIIGSHYFNMKNLRSRPLKELMWNYYFFCELEGNINTPDGEDMLIELKTICDKVKVLGTYYSHKER